jgi:hypothetical protein
VLARVDSAALDLDHDALAIDKLLTLAYKVILVVEASLRLPQVCGHIIRELILFEAELPDWATETCDW